MDVGPVELLIVLAVVLLLFGSKKLPELAKGMGQAAKEFRSGLHDHDEPETDVPESKTPELKAPELKTPEVSAPESKGAEPKSETSA
jgi:sec-independent protein translocase protein TatA